MVNYKPFIAMQSSRNITVQTVKPVAAHLEFSPGSGEVHGNWPDVSFSMHAVSVSCRPFWRSGQRLALRRADHPLPRVPGIVRRVHAGAPRGGAQGFCPEFFRVRTVGNSADDFAGQLVRRERPAPRQFEWEKLKLAYPVSAKHFVEAWRHPGRCPRWHAFMA